MSRSCSVQRSLLRSIVLLCAVVASSSCHEREEHHTTTYLNEWGVEVQGGEERARAVAEETGFLYVSRVGSLDDFHTFAHPNHPERHHEHAADKTASLHGHGEVRWAEQQKILKRSKRAVVPATTVPPVSAAGLQSNVAMSPNAAQHSEPYPLPHDPSWSQMWYHHRRIQDPRPVWQRGFTGRGVVVSILDDGIDYTHTDLRLPYDAEASHDFNDNDSDPMPRNSVQNRHGTRCAGEVAATMNDFCIVGAAYNSSIGGVRMLDGPVTDRVEGSSLSFHPQHIDIYSSSWGPDDDGVTVDGPAKQALAAFKNGAEKGRGGLGSIFVWASGNGGRKGDSCGCDGYTNTIYSISVSAMSQLGHSPWYSEHCASTMASTYSSGSGIEQKIITVDFPGGQCTTQHTGTSASAPMAAGLLALALEANPKLTWRDMQHVVALTAQPHPRDVPSYQADIWSRNGAGHKFSHEFGFGLMHTAGMTNLALHWETVPEMRTCLETVTNIEKNEAGSFTLEATACVGTANEVRYAENVVAIVTVGSSVRGALKFDLTSPMGTKSNLLPFRNLDHDTRGFDGWRFLTVFNWGENPRGNWKFDVEANVPVQVHSVQLEIHGTLEPPKILKLPELEECHSQCFDGCIGLSSTDCHSCRELTLFKTDGSFDCVGGEECPPGYVKREKTCRPCPVQGCWRCSQAPTTCEVCSPGLSLQENRCSTEPCPAGTIYSSNASACVSCSPQCSKCANETACASCSSGLKWQGQCVSQCPPDVSFQRGSDQCVRCHADCVGCGPTSSTCRRCKAPMVRRDNGSCSARCAQSQVAVSGVCQPCPPTCAMCSPAMECSVCKPGFLRTDDKKCVASCPAGTRASAAHNRCEPCQSSSCLSCTTDASVCSQCKPDFLLGLDGRCVGECPSDQFADAGGRFCRPCSVVNCARCAASGSSCEQCDTDMFVLRGGGQPESCLTTCPVGYYGDTQSQQCTRCSGECLSCSSATKCSTCPVGMLRYSSVCLKTCPRSTFRHGNTCEACDPSCATCLGPGVKNCTRCQAPGNMVDAETGCTQGCRPGFFSNSTHCVQCDLNCAECDVTATACTSCHVSEVRHGEQCVKSCPQGFVADQSGVCGVCHDECTSCPPGQVLLQGRCVAGCPRYGFSLQDGKCEKCADDSCRLCTGSSQMCEECQPPRRFLMKDSCVSMCPHGHFSHGRNICHTCHSSCATCVSAEATQCSSCFDSRVLQSGSCVASCDSGYFARASHTGETPVCLPCDSQCLSCINDTQCRRCKPGFALAPNGSCVGGCSLGMVLDSASQRCLQCPENCQRCNSATHCNNCKSPMLLHAGKCYRTCPAGLYQNGDRCRRCRGECATCSSADTCDTCATGLHRRSNGECRATCDAGQFSDVGGQCVKCHAMCKTCSGPGKKHCIRCVDSLPDGWFSRVDGSCTRCASGCKSCLGSAAHCTDCHNNYHLADNACIPICLVGQYYNAEENRCAACASSCQNCSNGISCESCASDHRMSVLDGSCYPCCGSSVVNTNVPCCACKKSPKWCSPPDISSTSSSAGHNVGYRHPENNNKKVIPPSDFADNARHASLTNSMRVVSIGIAGLLLMVMTIFLVLLLRRRFSSKTEYSKLAVEDNEGEEMSEL